MTSWRLTTAVASLLLLAGLCAHAERPRVLFINSYHQGYVWSDEETRGVLQALHDSKLDPLVFVEYLDSQRHRGDAFEQAWINLIIEKYHDLQPSIIVTSDDPATILAFRLREKLDWTIPIVFCGVNSSDGDSWVRHVSHAHGAAAGVLEMLPFVETAAVASRLHPAVREIVILNYGLPEIRYDLMIERQLKGVKARLLPTAYLSTQSLRDELEQLKPGTIVVAASFSRDLSDDFFTAEQSIKFVVAHSPVPVYGTTKDSLGLGIVGGKLNDGFYHGMKAGKMAAQVLRGASPSLLGISADTGEPYQFDYLQLQRWHIPESLIPPGSVILNKPLSIYRVHKGTIWTAVAFVVLQSFTIVGLLWLRARQKRVEAALSKSEQQFRSTFEQSAVGMAQVGLNGKCLMVNQLLCDTLGYSREEFLNNRLSDFLYRDAADQSAPTAFSFASSRIEQRYRHKLGQTVWMNQCASLVRNPQNDETCYLVALEDVTERKVAEEQLRRSNGALRQFAYAAAHQLQEPLRNVALCCEMLAVEMEHGDRPSVDWLIQESTRGARRMQQMVKDLLAFSRATEAKPEQAAVTDSNSAVAAVLANLESPIAEARATVSCGPLPLVAAHESQVVHIFQNLLENALKYRKPGVPPLINISASLSGGCWAFVVADNGIGFPPEHAKRIFGLFKRLHDQEYPGNGIGLAICARIVEYYGGTIWAEGALGKGASIYFTLPQIREPRPLFDIDNTDLARERATLEDIPL